MGKIIFLSAFLLSPLLAQAQYFCSADAKRDGLMYKDQNQAVWEIVNLQFEKTPFLGSYLACTKLLDRIPLEWNTQAKLSALYPASQKVARLGTDDALISLCLDTPSCHLSFFENFFSPKALFKSWLKPKTFSKGSTCLKRGSEDEEEIQKADLFTSSSLSLQSVWHVPDEKLDQKLFERLDQENPKKIYLSSMIFSRSILERLDDWLQKHPASEAWVFFAYNLHVLEHDFPENYQPHTAKLHLFPVFQTPFAKDSYHIKGMALEGKKLSTILMTVNIRRFREEKVADRVFVLSGEEAFHSYIDILSQVLDEQCSHLDLLSCSNELRYGESTSRAKQISEWVQSSCQNRFHFKLKEYEKPLFTRARFTPLETQITDLIRHAKKSIFLSSHVFHESKTSLALLEAAARGVEVKLLIGTKIEDHYFYDRIAKPLHLRALTHETGVTAHAKFMVVDEEVAIWGTGNFTKTSLQNPWEIFLSTKDPKFLSELKDYEKEYYR